MSQQSRSLVFFIFKWAFIVGIVISTAVGAYITIVIIPNLPDSQTLKNIHLQTPLSVYSKEGKLIAKFGEKKRIPTLYDDIPTMQINAFLAAEDKDFFQHSGVDFFGLVRAATQLILTGEKKQGGSTITMQVARNFFLTKEKTYIRKVREILLSFTIEQQLSKQEILALYLNKIYLGHRSYGIAAAADVYYGKPLSALTLAEQAMIAGLPKAPSAFNPISNPKRALIRRNYVLSRLARLNYINKQQHDDATAQPITSRLNSLAIELHAPFVAEMVRDEMHKMYGDDIYTSGMHVYTTISATQQEAANHAVKNALHDYDKRHGYRGTLGHIDLTEQDVSNLDLTPLASFKLIGETEPAIVTAINDLGITTLTKDNQPNEITWDDLKWAWPYINENKQGKQPKTAADILSIGDIVRVRKKPDNLSYELAQVPEASGAIVAMNPDDGSLTALVGGYDYFYNKFNRAFQAKRQPGSGFKPILYSAALSKGYTTATLINDAPVVFDDAGLEQQWRPENYSGKFFGPTRLREALTHSRNLVSIRILRDIGVNYVRNFAGHFGFEPSSLPRNLSLALGSGAANPYQMATAYSVLANGGFQITPYFIDKIISYSGDELFKADPMTASANAAKDPDDLAIPTVTSPEDALDLNSEDTRPLSPKKATRVMSSQVSFLINSLLRDVVKRGTGRRALSLGRSDLAGKTGTTNEQRDAWFNGFNPSLVAVAWVGKDNSSPLGNRETGGRAALPIWMSFMKDALKGTPNQELSQPDGIVGILIDPETGLKTNPSNPRAIFEYFREDNVPASAEQNNPSTNSSAEQQTIEELF
ncbi:MAG: peptidase [Cycloclasticus sp.]|nr:MAG: peptidase [Cycloclasticus sp.]